MSAQGRLTLVSAQGRLTLVITLVDDKLWYKLSHLSLRITLLLAMQNSRPLMISSLGSPRSVPMSSNSSEEESRRQGSRLWELGSGLGFALRSVDEQVPVVGIGITYEAFN